MPIQSPGYGLYTYDDTPQDPENKPTTIHQSWMKEPEKFTPMLKIDIKTGKKLIDNTAKLKKFEEVRSDMREARKAHNAIPAPPKEQFVELIKKHRGKLNQIAQEMKVSWHVVRKWVKQYDLEVMAKKQQEVSEHETIEKIIGNRAVTKEDLTLELADQLAEAGVRQKIIAEKFGFSTEMSYRNRVAKLRKLRDKGEPQERKCRVCGCTELNACPGGCHWVDDDLCSRCADGLKDAAAAKKTVQDPAAGPPKDLLKKMIDTDARIGEIAAHTPPRALIKHPKGGYKSFPSVDAALHFVTNHCSLEQIHTMLVYELVPLNVKVVIEPAAKREES